ncbi:unnamed protein product [Litomosoides sigmodontis]|uniref:Uncharacterized protein n=1 Tax=Litomosoides sigmodontis TaxID=42156 RepID=A0A3P6VA19_LITSI|nr:unnamed protein product [Litomosoides sigmodontis]
MKRINVFSAECPRKRIEGFKNKNEATGPAQAPGSVPPESQITCTYMHNAKLELDQLFSDDVLAVLDQIARRLKREVKVNLIFQKINCAEGRKRSECFKYSLQEPFHWLIINDLEKGDVVYEITAKYNHKKAIIEASLLNILSQHSVHDLTVYCSKEAGREVGFVRRLSDEELMAKRRKLEVTKFKSAISLSPLELDLIEPLILERRSFDEPLNWHQLQRIDESRLDDALNNDGLTFILFWNIDNMISKHAFYLWAEASKSLVSRHPTVIFGALSCHEFDEFCNDRIARPTDYHTVFAYTKNDIFGKTKELRDAKYYIEWAQLLLLSPAHEIRSDDELKQIKAGKMELFEGIRPAITIGIFDDRNSNEAEIFMQMAENLKGRYHFAYLIKQSHPKTVYTIRAREQRKRIDFTGTYEIQGLTDFVIRSSLPSVASIDISNGFTSNILTHQMQPVILFVDNEKDGEMSTFEELCSKSPYVICTVIMNSSKSKVMSEVIQSFQTNDHSKRLIIFLRDKIYAFDVKDGLKSGNLLQLITLSTTDKPISTLGIDDVHPLRYIQMAQINKIFGEQLVDMPSEGQIIKRSHVDNGDDMDDNVDYGGCPVMAKARQIAMKTEL